MHLVDKYSIKDLMDAAFISPSKDKGQNFLVDVEKCKNIVKLLKNDVNSKVLEIGPGLGSLTYHLQERCNNLTLVDVDERIIYYLECEVNQGVELVLEDALKYDVSSYDYIISNIPYSITSDLMEHILIHGTKVKQFVLMMQKENFAHFYDVSGSEYGPLSVLVHLLGNIKKEFDVGASSFVPRPKCTSTVFTIETNNLYDREKAIQAYRLSKKLFLNRRKTILNNLGAAIGKEKALKVLESLNISPLKRPEELSPDIFYQINTIINEND